MNTRALYCDETLIPDPQDAEKLMTDKTRAICLVTPNNPAGVEYSDDLLHDFLFLAQKYNVKLILDETYLDFRTIDDVHTLWSHPAAQDHLIVLYSFSKAYRLTGHRVGAVIASPHQITEIEKFLDTVTICPAQTGQFAAQWGLEHLDDWVEQERQQTIQKLTQFRQAFDRLLPYGWKLLGSGAYFAYVATPFQHDLNRGGARHCCNRVMSLPCRVPFSVLMKPALDTIICVWHLPILTGKPSKLLLIV